MLKKYAIHYRLTFRRYFFIYLHIPKFGGGMEKEFSIRAVLMGILASDIPLCDQSELNELIAFITKNWPDAEDWRVRQHLINQHYLFMQPNFVMAVYDFICFYFKLNSKIERIQAFEKFVSNIEKSIGKTVSVKAFW